MTDTFVESISGKQTITKDPNAVLDYTWPWEEWLTPIEDTIASAVVTGDGVEIESYQVSDDNLSVIAFISGGEVPEGKSYGIASATCRITTVDGRIEDRTMYFKIKER